jgi:hypothetical protein
MFHRLSFFLQLLKLIQEKKAINTIDIYNGSFAVSSSSSSWSCIQWLYFLLSESFLISVIPILLACAGYNAC